MKEDGGTTYHCLPPVKKVLHEA